MRFRNHLRTSVETRQRATRIRAPQPAETMNCPHPPRCFGKLEEVRHLLRVPPGCRGRRPGDRDRPGVRGREEPGQESQEAGRDPRGETADFRSCGKGPRQQAGPDHGQYPQGRGQNKDQASRQEAQAPSPAPSRGRGCLPGIPGKGKTGQAEDEKQDRRGNEGTPDHAEMGVQAVDHDEHGEAELELAQKEGKIRPEETRPPAHEPQDTPRNNRRNPGGTEETRRQKGHPGSVFSPGDMGEGHPADQDRRQEEPANGLPEKPAAPQPGKPGPKGKG